MQGKSSVKRLGVDVKSKVQVVQMKKGGKENNLKLVPSYFYNIKWLSFSDFYTDSYTHIYEITNKYKIIVSTKICQLHPFAPFSQFWESTQVN